MGFWEILGQNRSIFMKNGSRNLKSRYLRNTFLLSTFAVIELGSWNLAKLENKWGQKIVGVHFLEFFIFNLIFDTLTWFLPIFANMVPNMRLKIKNSKKWTPTIFCPHLYSNLAKFQLHSSITAKVDSKNVFLRYRD